MDRFTRVFVSLSLRVPVRVRVYRQCVRAQASDQFAQSNSTLSNDAQANRRLISKTDDARAAKATKTIRMERINQMPLNYQIALNYQMPRDYQISQNYHHHHHQQHHDHHHRNHHHQVLSSSSQQIEATLKASAAAAAAEAAAAATTVPVESSPSPSSTGSKRSKRVRTIFTPEQLKCLEAEFSNQMYLVGQDRGFLANSLGLTEAQVKVWFQNRRIKFRKCGSQQQELQQEFAGS